MFDYSDTEMALALRYRREVDGVVSDAQRIVDRQAASIARLQAQLDAARSELVREKSRRQSLEFENERLNRLLDMPVG